MISQEVFLEAEASYSTGLAGGFFTLKITTVRGAADTAPLAVIKKHLLYCIILPYAASYSADSTAAGQ